jgi:monofunctional biosynthetic peptidoglycan transglycosylase
MAEAAGTLKGERARGRSLSQAWRWLRLLVIALAVLVALPLVLAPLYALINPPVTTVMLAKALGGNGIDKSWASIDEISPRLVRAVMTSEDQRFCFHHGIDWVEVENALDDEDGRFRGASTITMQMVKNLFLWTGHSWIRKALEAPLALYIEFFLSKRRIMEIYLNIVEWDEGVYGAAAAAGHYFHETPAQLTAMQSALLAAVLPSPATRDAAKPGRGTARIARRIASRMAAGQADASCVLK